ncbi:MAG TPA: RQC domain-containing protein, partial [Azospirillaceae bacterium]|nr:RQC domain-containing protein [Azospirillaceae bacterium]
TLPAQKALSAVYRTGQRFGVGHLVDVLRGLATEKVTKFHHDKLKTFGVGSDLSKGEWSGVFRQLVAFGYLTADPEGHGGLILTDQARPVLKGEETVRLRKERTSDLRKSGRSSSSRGSSRGEMPALSPEDDALWHALKAVRLDLARSQGVPPYVIFHDTTLLEMVRVKPQGMLDLGLIPGVGSRKLERYGEVFLEVIHEYS